MKKDDTVYLRHILDAIEQIRRYLAGVSYEQFLQNHLTRDGVVRQLEIVGEAAANISDAFRAAHAEIPWSKVVGIRNRLIHAYFQVNLAIVWDTAQTDLPVLKQHIESALKSS